MHTFEFCIDSNAFKEESTLYNYSFVNVFDSSWNLQNTLVIYIWDGQIGHDSIWKVCYNIERNLIEVTLWILMITISADVPMCPVVRSSGADNGPYTSF